MILTEKYKSYSLYLEQEHEETIIKLLENLSDEELKVFFDAYTDPDFEASLASLELDREIVSVEQWIEDDYYTGTAGQTIYKPWKDDLIELFESDNYDLAIISGGIGCQDPKTEVLTDRGKVMMGDLSRSHRYLSYDSNLKRFGYQRGTQAFAKGKGMMYRVEHEHGSFVASGNHLVLCADHRYRSVAQLYGNPRAIVSSQSESDLAQDGVLRALRLKQKFVDYLGDCWKDHRLCDELLPLVAKVCQSSAPLHVDVPSRASFFREAKSFYNQLFSLRVARNGSLDQMGDHSCVDLDLADVEISLQTHEFCQRALQSHESIAFLRDTLRALVQTIEDLQPTQNSKPDCHLCRQICDEVVKTLAQHVGQNQRSNQLSRQSLGRILSRQMLRLFFFLYRPSKPSQVFSSQGCEHNLKQWQGYNQFPRLSRGRLGHGARHLSVFAQAQALGLLSLAPLNILHQRTHSRILSVEKVKTDWYWDLHVPGTNNYCSGGAVHHNSGKSTFSQLATMRMLYEASCLANPARSYGLAPNSVIGFCNLAPSKETARRVVFEGIGAKLEDSPYFKYDFPPIKDVKDEIIFPKGLTIVAGSSSDSSIIGMNIIGGIFDEGNFMKTSSKVKKENMAEHAKWGHFGKAGKLFESVRRRMKSRYMRKGRLPGVLMVISSKTTHDAFTEQLVRKNIGTSTTFCRDRNIIDVKRDSFEDKTFRVLVGDEKHRSKILSENEDESKFEGATIIEIPEDLRTDFEDNVDGALRDIAGVSTLAIHPFMSRPEKIDEIIDERKHPFVCPLMPDTTQWDSQYPYRIKWNEIARKDMDGNWQPIYNPHAKRHVHFDPALTGDGFGLCIAHVAGSVPVESKSGIVEQLPFFVIDFVLRVQGEPGEEVIFKNVRQLCYEFTAHGFHLAEFSMDQYQSREMIQALRQQGYKAGIYSVDTGQASLDEDGPARGERTIEGWVDNKRKQAYRYFRTAIYDGRVRSYFYEPLIKELKGLEETPIMIDHPSSGSKDVADAVCGCIWTLFRANYALTPLPPIKGISELKDGIIHDENYQEVEVRDDAIVAPSKAPRQYHKKKKIATIPPTYTKIAADGEEIDLTDSGQETDYDPFIGRG